MEELVIFRLFMAFPVIGLLIPDIGLLLSDYRISRIPSTHLIIEITLAISIAICTWGITHLKRKEERKPDQGKSLIGA